MADDEQQEQNTQPDTEALRQQLRQDNLQQLQQRQEHDEQQKQRFIIEVNKDHSNLSEMKKDTKQPKEE